MRTRNSAGGYFAWLCSLVDDGHHKEWGSVLAELHSFEFIPVVPNDDNRCSDGLALRAEFDERSMNDTECTVFEMMIGLARRMGFQTVDLGQDIEIRPHFWKLVENLGVRPGQKRANEQRIVNMVDRQYLSNGSGGLFPLHKPRRDQRKVELWYQMMAYLDEVWYKEN